MQNVKGMPVEMQRENGNEKENIFRNKGKSERMFR